MPSIQYAIVSRGPFADTQSTLSSMNMTVENTYVFGAVRPPPIQDISVGLFAKISNFNERFWTKILAVHPNGTIIGQIDNILVSTQEYGLDDIIAFEYRNIFCVRSDFDLTVASDTQKVHTPARYRSYSVRRNIVNKMRRHRMAIQKRRVGRGL